MGAHAREYYDDVYSVGEASDVTITGEAPGTSGIDASLGERGAISGTVTSAATGRPVSDVIVYLLYSTEADPDNPDGWAWDEYAQSEADGSYYFDAQPGTYRLAFERSSDEDDGQGGYELEFYLDAHTIDRAQDVHVASAVTTDGIDAALDPTLARAPTALEPPRITGQPRVGMTLTATSGTWSPAPTSFAYAWSVDGRRVAGATGRTFSVRPEHVGLRLSVRVTARRAGSHDGIRGAMSPAVVVRPRLSLTTRVTGRTVRLGLRVTAAGVRTVTGRVRVLRDGQLLRLLTLRSGSTAVRLPRQPSGRHTYQVTYLGGGPVLARTASVRVRL